MTNMVIRQEDNMVIEIRLPVAHSCPMPKTAKNIAPPLLAQEMRPERIGYRLMLLREALGYTPSQISDILGIERTYWSRFEGGKRAITDPFAALLVDRFGVTLDFIVLGKWDKLPVDLAEKMRSVERLQS